MRVARVDLDERKIDFVLPDDEDASTADEDLFEDGSDADDAADTGDKKKRRRPRRRRKKPTEGATADSADTANIPDDDRPV